MCQQVHCFSPDRIIAVSGKVSDRFCLQDPELGMDHVGYVPADINLGGGDYLEFDVCLDCGTIQGTWPVSSDELWEAVCLA